MRFKMAAIIDKITGKRYKRDYKDTLNDNKEMQNNHM